MYAAGTSKDAVAFNSVQRGHQQARRVQPQASPLLHACNRCVCHCFMLLPAPPSLWMCCARARCVHAAVAAAACACLLTRPVLTRRLLRTPAGAGNLSYLSSGLAAGWRAPPVPRHARGRVLDHRPHALGKPVCRRGSGGTLWLCLEPLYLVRPRGQRRSCSVVRARTGRRAMSAARVDQPIEKEVRESARAIFLRSRPAAAAGAATQRAACAHRAASRVHAPAASFPAKGRAVSLRRSSRRRRGRQPDGAARSAAAMLHAAASRSREAAWLELHARRAWRCAALREVTLQSAPRLRHSRSAWASLGRPRAP
jgi:hypothetical protein